MSAREDALLHPIRMRIVQVLASAGPYTARQIDDALSEEVPQTSLYRHLGRLVEVGLIEVASERPVRGSVEKTYALAGLTDSTAPAGPDATAEEHFRAFLSTIAVQLGTVSRYLEQGVPDLSGDGVSWQAVPAWLSDDELAELVEIFREAISHDPTPDRRLRLIALATVPVMDEPES